MCGDRREASERGVSGAEGERYLMKGKTLAHRIPRCVEFTKAWPKSWRTVWRGWRLLSDLTEGARLFVAPDTT